MGKATISTALAAAVVLAARIVVVDPRDDAISESNLPGRQGVVVPTGSSASATRPGSDDVGPGTRDTNGSGAYGAVCRARCVRGCWAAPGGARRRSRATREAACADGPRAGDGYWRMPGTWSAKRGMFALNTRPPAACIS